MPRTPLFSWKGKEYEHRPKGADWYWAIAIIALSTALATILFGNYLLAAVILVGAVAIVLHAKKEPPTHTFSVSEQGLGIDEEFHAFPDMMSFSILEDAEEALPPLLSIKTSNWLSPHLVIPLEGVAVDQLHAHFASHVEEAEHRPTLADVVAGWLGF